MSWSRAAPSPFGGITVPYAKGLAGHSDADVGIHALCDAIYGAWPRAISAATFPRAKPPGRTPTAPASSSHAAERVRARGGRIANVDVTLICEQPKITPHAPAMIARLAGLLGLDAARVSVKATTTERLGFAGGARDRRPGRS